MRRGSREWKDEESYIQMDTPMLICMRQDLGAKKKKYSEFLVCLYSEGVE